MTDPSIVPCLPSVPPVPRIVRLPANLINQIAAGEVVERAASVVKELCENSLDAGARRIDVEIIGGGRTRIRIVDDGGGMTPEEARLALERHATSKIACAEDLWGVQTFGFRGEALPSIASVSRITLQTRRPDADEGFLFKVEAGVEVESRAVGMPKGTQIEVNDLFFNTPARLKFQKTEATETGNISEALLRLAVANPDVHFRLRANGRVTFDLPPHRDLGERVRAALTRRGAGVLHEAVGDEHGACVQAFLASPDCASTTSRNAFTFVGRRFVRDRSLLQALCMAYGDVLEKGRYPLAIVFVDVAGEDVDVNVHPQKLEVRFAQPQPVYAAVRHVLAAALARAPWAVASSITRSTYSLPPNTLADGARDAARGPLPSPWSGTAREQADRHATDTASSRVDVNQLFASPPAPQVSQHPSYTAASLPPAHSVSDPLSQSLGQLRHIGVLADRYLLLEGQGRELVLVDQSAAYQRVLRQNLIAAMRKGSLVHQRLLFPIPLAVDKVTMARFSSAAPSLQRWGFEVEAFGALSLLIRSVPELLAAADPKPLLLDVLNAVRVAPVSAGEAEEPGLPLDVLAAMERHGVMHDNAQEPLGVAKLLAELDALGPQPEERPVAVRLALHELQARFGRV